MATYLFKSLWYGFSFKHFDISDFSFDSSRKSKGYKSFDIILLEYSTKSGAYNRPSDVAKLIWLRIHSSDINGMKYIEANSHSDSSNHR